MKNWNITEIQNALSDYKMPDKVSTVHLETQKLAAVLVALIESHSGLDIVLTRRAKHLRHHPGQVSFPGGKWDKSDHTLLDTAVREAQEEIALPSEQLKILGTFPGHKTTSGFDVTPIVAFSNYAGPWTPDFNEVDSVLTVPLSWVIDESRWRIETGIFKGEPHQYRVSWWKRYLIWGATAEMLFNFRRCLKNSCL